MPCLVLRKSAELALTEATVRYDFAPSRLHDKLEMLNRHARFGGTADDIGTIVFWQRMSGVSHRDVLITQARFWIAQGDCCIFSSHATISVNGRSWEDSMK